METIRVNYDEYCAQRDRRIAELNAQLHEAERALAAFRAFVRLDEQMRCLGPWECDEPDSRWCSDEFHARYDNARAAVEPFLGEGGE
jgi:hypothetical protein